MANTMSNAEKAFEAYKNLTGAERRDFTLLCKGYEAQGAPKTPKPQKAAARAAAAGGKEDTQN